MVGNFVKLVKIPVTSRQINNLLFYYQSTCRCGPLLCMAGSEAIKLRIITNLGCSRVRVSARTRQWWQLAQHNTALPADVEQFNGGKVKDIASAMLKLGDGTWLTCDSVGCDVCKAGDHEQRCQGRHVTGLCSSSHFQQMPLMLCTNADHHRLPSQCSNAVPWYPVLLE